MTPSPSPTQHSSSEPGWLKAWWQEDRVSFLRTIALLIALVSFMFLWPRLIEVGGPRVVFYNMVLHLYVAAWLIVTEYRGALGGVT